MANKKVICCILRDRYSIEKVIQHFSRNGYEVSHSACYAQTSMIKIQFFCEGNTLSRHIDAIFDEIWHYAGVSDDLLDMAKNKLRDLNCIVKIYRE